MSQIPESLSAPQRLAPHPQRSGGLDFALVLKLSLFGAVMALATVFIVPSNVEPLLWLLIFGVCAYLIAARAPAKPFLHGLFVSLVNCVWITGAHIALAPSYLLRHRTRQQCSARCLYPTPHAL